MVCIELFDITMKIIRFKRDGAQHWEIAFNETHLREKLNGETATVIMPAKPWWVRLWRKIRPLQGIEVPADGVTRTAHLG